MYGKINNLPSFRSIIPSTSMKHRVEGFFHTVCQTKPLFSPDEQRQMNADDMNHYPKQVIYITSPFHLCLSNQLKYLCRIFTSYVFTKKQVVKYIILHSP